MSTFAYHPRHSTHEGYPPADENIESALAAGLRPAPNPATNLLMWDRRNSASPAPILCIIPLSIAEEKKEVNSLFEDGISPESEGKVVPCLVVEADGVSPALHKEQERRAEIKVGIAHEGWQQISKERYRLREKSVCSGIMSGGRFWEGFSLALASKYHLGQIGKLIVDGDGAPWDHHLPILDSDKTEARLDPFLYKFYTIADRVSQQYCQQHEAFY